MTKKSHGGKAHHARHTAHTGETHHKGHSMHGMKMDNMKHSTEHSSYGSKHGGTMHQGHTKERSPSGGPSEAVPQNEHVSGKSGMTQTMGGSIGKGSVPSMHVTGRKTGMQGPNVSGRK